MRGKSMAANIGLLQRKLGLASLIVLITPLCACGVAAVPSLTPTPLGGGGQIAFASDRDGSLHIYVMMPDGSDVRRLTDLAADYWAPGWTSDGQRVVFRSQFPGRFHIYSITADGTDMVRLVDQSFGGSGAALSPDGKRIAFDDLRGSQQDICVCLLYTSDAADE